ncbi:MAG: ribosomal protein S18-alanine N-acetyltransferase [Anaerolineae bacterium]|nr:ribosomal protein S18-alanine N-acetyltransferase [Anaerolineae bacterium]
MSGSSAGTVAQAALTSPAVLLIRPMRLADIPAVLSIERQAFPSPWPESAYRYELKFRQDSFFYVLQQRATEPVGLAGERANGLPLLGYVGFRMRKGAAHICTIAVHVRWRRRGLGKFLLLFAVDKALARGAKQVTLEVRASNKVAFDLYRQVGFERAGVRPAYYRDGEDAWPMVLHAPDAAAVERLRGMQRALNVRLATWSNQEGR